MGSQRCRVKPTIRAHRQRPPAPRMGQAQPNPIFQHDPDQAGSKLESDSDSACDSKTLKQIIQVIGDHYDRSSSPSSAHPDEYDGCPMFSFRNQDSYPLLMQRLQQQHPALYEHFHDLRISWNTATKTLILNLMAPKPIHGVAQREIPDILIKGRDRLRDENPHDEDVQKICNSLNPTGESQILLEDNNNVTIFDRTPDGGWRFEGHKFPPFVFEIANSQTSRNLYMTVDQYMERLPGFIGSVMAVKCNYNSANNLEHEYTWKVSLWVAKLSYASSDDTLLRRSSRLRTKTPTVQIHKLVDEAVFRRNGETVPGSLNIPLEAWVPPFQREDYPEAVLKLPVIIDFEDLSESAGKAERQQRTTNMPQEDKKVLEMLASMQDLEKIGPAGRVAQKKALPRGSTPGLTKSARPSLAGTSAKHNSGSGAMWGRKTVDGGLSRTGTTGGRSKERKAKAAKSR